MNKPKILVVGQVVIDTIYQDRDRQSSTEPMTRFGGKAFNLTVALARLGARVDLVGAIGGDDEGTEAERVLSEEGVGISHLKTCSTGRGAKVTTPKVIMSEGRYGERRAELEMDERITSCYRASLGCLDEASADILIFTLEFDESLFAMLSEKIDLLKSRSRILVVGNPAPFGRTGPTPQVLGLLRRADILTPNRYEAGHLLGDKKVKSLDPNVAKRIIDTYGCREAYVTCGDRGWSWATSNRLSGVGEPDAVALVDKVGASDLFTAVVSLCRYFDVSPRVAAESAGYAASWAVQREGGASSFPTLVDFEKALDESDLPKLSEMKSALDVLRS